MSEGQNYDPTPEQARRLRRKLYGIAGVLAAVQLAYVLAFTHNQPWADEWEFVPALCGQESVGHFLWAQHNEHRLPLPRLIFLGLFQLTHDFRAGSVLQVLAYTALAFAGMRWSAELRGRPAWADLFFPFTLLHVGHSENLLMGYQFCFALACLLVIGLARLAMRANEGNRLHTAFGAVLLSAALCLVGGFGTVFALPAMVWVWYLAAIPWKRSENRRFAAAIVVLLSLFPLLYLRFYFQDYQRPEGHPPFELKNWGNAAQITMEVIAVGFGIGVEWIWPVVFTGILAASGFVAVEGVRRFRTMPGERPRVFGWVAVCVGVCGLAVAIGAGRSGFGRTSGLWPRYAMLTWPFIAVLYFAAVAWGRPKLKWIPAAFLALSLAVYPVNLMHGYGWGLARDFAGWEIDSALREHQSPEAISRLFEGTYQGGQEERAVRGIPMLHSRGIGPFAQ